MKKLNLADIPQLTRMNGGATWSLADIKNTLARFEESYGIDLDPDFQRGHVWTEDQQQKFVEYLIRGGQAPTIRFNGPAYSGERRSKNTDLSEAIVLVDGKQRLTACLRFLDDELRVFDGYSLSQFENPQLVVRRTELHYQVNRLQTRHELLKWYLEINEGQIAHSEEELNRVRLLFAQSVPT